MPGGSSAQERIALVFRKQAEQCDEGSPFYGAILRRVLDDLAAEGPTWRLLQGHDDDRYGSALALRFLGAVHRLVLEGRAPDLAARWPPVDVPVEEVWPVYRATVEEHLDALRTGIERPVQTNEVGRCAALLGGFLLVAAETGLPLRVLEVGASGGLNLRWDRYAYEGDGRWWGDRSSPVRFEGVYEQGVPPLDQPATVAERRGCDPNPVDPTTEEGRLTLLSFVWPDQRHRIAQLKAAIAIARAVPAAIDRAGAVEWLDAQLPSAPGAATVVYHSIVMQYLPREDRPRVEELVADAGSRATADAPVAWLRFEPGGDRADVHLTVWPGGKERHLARSGYHGRPVTWLAS